jgi:hypothetical protein
MAPARGRARYPLPESGPGRRRVSFWNQVVPAVVNDPAD